MHEPFIPVTREQAAEILSTSLTSLDELVKSGIFPPPRSLGQCRRKYWHPDVFYSHLERALLGANIEVNSEQTPPHPTSTPRPRQNDPRQNHNTSVVGQTRNPLAAPSKRGRADARARQAARLASLAT